MRRMVLASPLPLRSRRSISNPPIARAAVVAVALAALGTALAPGLCSGQYGILTRSEADTSCVYYESMDQPWHRYLIDSPAPFGPGDCVRLDGVGMPCPDGCPSEMGCLHVRGIGEGSGCTIEECGRLVEGQYDCLYFYSARHGIYVLTDLRDFAAGDSVAVRGRMLGGFWFTNCLATDRCIEVSEILPCGSTPVKTRSWGRLRLLYR